MSYIIAIERKSNLPLYCAGLNGKPRINKAPRLKVNKVDVAPTMDILHYIFATVIHQSQPLLGSHLPSVLACPSSLLPSFSPLSCNAHNSLLRFPMTNSLPPIPEAGASAPRPPSSAVPPPTTKRDASFALKNNKDKPKPPSPPLKIRDGNTQTTYTRMGLLGEVNGVGENPRDRPRF